MGSTFYQDEHQCDECGERFWGGAKAQFCSAACRSRRWRAQQTLQRTVTLAELCKEVLRRRELGSGGYSKLLPRLFRQVAVELRKAGWDPIELLMSIPDEPATDADSAPGGIEGTAPERRRWLHTPEREIELLKQTIEHREANGWSTRWHRERKAQLEKVLASRKRK